jgi:N-acetylmuramoyl-L-alanine amidase
MLFEEYRRESLELAEALRRAFASAGCRVRSVRAANLRVLRLAEMPAVLVELGFLTNRWEERQLRTRAYRERLVRALADGIEAFRDTVARTEGFSK